MPTNVTYKTDGKDIPTQLFQPAGTPIGGLVILAYGSDGLVDNENGPWKSLIEGYATDLASRGFVGAIPDYFESTGTQPGDLDVNNYRQQISNNHGAWQRTLKDATTELVKPIVLPGIDASRVALLGFSLGGYLCARIAPAVKALVVFFAPYMDGLGLDGPLSLHAEIHHGGNDILPYSGNAKRIDQELRNHGAISNLWPPYSDANHGFVGSDAANVDARRQSHERTMAFFDAHI